MGKVRIVRRGWVSDLQIPLEVRYRAVNCIVLHCKIAHFRDVNQDGDKSAGQMLMRTAVHASTQHTRKSVDNLNCCNVSLTAIEVHVWMSVS